VLLKLTRCHCILSISGIYITCGARGDPTMRIFQLKERVESKCEIEWIRTVILASHISPLHMHIGSMYELPPLQLHHTELQTAPGIADSSTRIIHPRQIQPIVADSKQIIKKAVSRRKFKSTMSASLKISHVDLWGCHFISEDINTVFECNTSSKPSQTKFVRRPVKFATSAVWAIWRNTVRHRSFSLQTWRRLCRTL
jgi:hypothetical protein